MATRINEYYGPILQTTKPGPVLKPKGATLQITLPTDKATVIKNLIVAGLFEGFGITSCDLISREETK